MICDCRPAIAPGRLRVVPEAATIAVGVTQFVFASSPLATWASSDEAIAAVDPLVTGAIRGVAPGTATITASYRGKTGTMTITVI
jgi:uncharacterized protein YjdB